VAFKRKHTKYHNKNLTKQQKLKGSIIMKKRNLTSLSDFIDEKGLTQERLAEQVQTNHTFLNLKKI
jgi:hypothetical protein